MPAQRVRLARPTTTDDVAAFGRALPGEGPFEQRLVTFQRAQGLAADGRLGPEVLRLAGASARDTLPDVVSRALAQPLPALGTTRPLSARAQAVAEALQHLSPRATLGLDAASLEGPDAVRRLAQPSAPVSSFEAASTAVLAEARTTDFQRGEAHATTALGFFTGA